MPPSECESFSARSVASVSTRSAPALRQNAVVNDAWIVQRFLNDSVLLVKSSNHNNVFGAMTIEPWSQAELETLRYDIYLLRLMQNSKHVPRIFESGSIQGYNYMVTSLHGQNLDQLRESMPSKRFTTGTSLRIALQAVDALADLHSAGFVHRNVKPSIFCFGGTASTLRTLQLVDFSLVRQTVVSPQLRTSELRRARERVVFRGSPRYCSVNVHRLKEPTTHDDLISVLFMTVEMITGKLPWDYKKRKDIPAVKKESPTELIFENCPNELVDLYQQLTSLTYYEPSNYSQISKTITKALTDRRIDLEDAYDWEEGGRYFYYKLKQERERMKEQNAAGSMVTALSHAFTSTDTDELYIPEVSDINTLDRKPIDCELTA
ncbi:hypothetical protein QR680_006436 [Steinernema hermaphroditum]|uniref:Protein kinase domain-containing protein n=1 Tax=Steinernema hermaphroditum TaxID=289476 RepID=A0AA39HWP3_9BILA|nr:hypothetical protein QR680_006436 [Steinernema hermaphroditum]